MNINNKEKQIKILLLIILLSVLVLVVSVLGWSKTDIIYYPIGIVASGLLIVICSGMLALIMDGDKK